MYNFHHVFHICLQHMYSQLKPYVPVAHSEKKLMHIVTQVYIQIIKSAIRQSNDLYYLITGEMCLIDYNTEILMYRYKITISNSHIK
jgi:hypothetical protein